MAQKGMRKERPARSRDSYLALTWLRHDDPDERNALEAAARMELRRAEYAKWPHALQAFENLAYLCGNHNVQFAWDRSNGFIMHELGVGKDVSPHDMVVARTIDNRLLRPTEKLVSMFSSPRPNPRVAPNTEDPQDKDAAAISEMVIDLLFERPMRMPELRTEVVMAAAVTGLAAIETEFTDSGLPIDVPANKTEKQTIDSRLFGKEEVETPVDGATQPAYMQDMHARIWTSLHLAADPGATDERSMKWIARSTFEDIDTIWDAFQGAEGFYPDRMSHVEQRKGTDLALFWWYRVQDLLDSPQGVWSGGMAPTRWGKEGGLAPNHTCLQVIDVEPSLRFPRGRTLVMAGEQLIFCADEARGYLPPRPNSGFPGRWHEYAFWRWFKLPGRFRGIAPVSLAVPLQRRVNAIDGMLKCNRSYIAIGQWLLPKHSKVAEGRMSGIPGQHVTFTDLPGYAKPERVKNDPLPSDVYNERKLCVDAIDWLFGVSLQDPQVAASAARANSILEFLRRERLEGKQPAIHAYERMLETVAQNTLLDVQAQLGEGANRELTKRLQLAARERGDVALAVFAGASIMDHHSVKIDIASEIMKSQEAMQERAQMALQVAAQFISQPQMQRLFEILELPVDLPAAPSVERAQRMLSWAAAGQLEALQIIPLVDQVQAMAPVFAEFLQSPRFVTLDEQIGKAISDFYYDVLVPAVQKQMQKQAEAQRQAAAMAEQQKGGEKAA